MVGGDHVGHEGRDSDGARAGEPEAREGIAYRDRGEERDQHDEGRKEHGVDQPGAEVRVLEQEPPA